MLFVDVLIKCFEVDVIKSRLVGENLKFKLDNVNMDLKLKEEDIFQMKVCLGNLEREKINI